MVWKALEVLVMRSEALGSVDVNTLCPLAGSLVADCVCAELIFACNFRCYLRAVSKNVMFLRYLLKNR